MFNVLIIYCLLFLIRVVYNIFRLLVLIEEYRRVWELQNYSQGLETSLYKLTTVLQRFIPDSSKMLTGRLMSISPKNSIHENGFNQ